MVNKRITKTWLTKNFLNRNRCNWNDWSENNHDSPKELVFVLHRRTSQEIVTQVSWSCMGCPTKTRCCPSVVVDAAGVHGSVSHLPLATAEHCVSFGGSWFISPSVFPSYSCFDNVATVILPYSHIQVTVKCFRYYNNSIYTVPITVTTTQDFQSEKRIFLTGFEPSGYDSKEMLQGHKMQLDCVFVTNIEIPMLKIRRSRNRLIFGMEIPYMGKAVFILRRSPGVV